MMAIASRRSILLTMMTGLGAFACGSGVVDAQQKMTKEQAEYQDQPKGILMCGTCSLFVRPKSCKVVEGDVAETGWCKAFDLQD